MIPTPPSEPPTCPQEPAGKSEKADDPKRHWGVVEHLPGDWIYGRQAEDDGQEANPEAGDQRDRLGSPAQSKGASLEVARVGESHGDGDTVGNVETDGGDGCRAVECDWRAKCW